MMRTGHNQIHISRKGCPLCTIMVCGTQQINLSVEGSASLPSGLYLRNRIKAVFALWSNVLGCCGYQEAFGLVMSQKSRLCPQTDLVCITNLYNIHIFVTPSAVIGAHVYCLTRNELPWLSMCPIPPPLPPPPSRACISWSLRNTYNIGTFIGFHWHAPRDTTYLTRCDTKENIPQCLFCVFQFHSP